MSDTPRVDALISDESRRMTPFALSAIYDLARQLERELAAMTDERDTAINDLRYWLPHESTVLIAERDALKAELAAAREERDALLRLASAYLLALENETVALRDSNLAMGDPDEARPARRRMIDAQNKAVVAYSALKAAIDAAREEPEFFLGHDANYHLREEGKG